MKFGLDSFFKYAYLHLMLGLIYYEDNLRMYNIFPTLRDKGDRMLSFCVEYLFIDQGS